MENIDNKHLPSEEELLAQLTRDARTFGKDGEGKDGLTVDFGAINDEVVRMVGCGDISVQAAARSYDQTMGGLIRTMEERGDLPAQGL